MGWSFPWVSSLDSEFNFDYAVSFTPAQREHGATYNFRPIAKPYDEMPGLSAFALEDGVVYHTYSCCARGLDAFNRLTSYSTSLPEAVTRATFPRPWPGSAVTTGTRMSSPGGRARD